MRLPRVEYAAFNEYKKDAPPPVHCCKDTRKKILDQIEKWGEGHDEHCVFWLSGMAGTGKSTIARTVTNTFYQKNRLGASFFFSRGQGRRAEADDFFSTLSLGLTSMIPEFAACLDQRLPKYSLITERSLFEQWQCLIIDPLNQLGAKLLSPLTLVIVVDALGECRESNYVPDIITLFAEANNVEMIRLRIFVTSRREEYIVNRFKQIPSIICSELVLDFTVNGSTERDISTYLESKLTKIAKANNMGIWPGEKNKKALEQLSGRLVHCSRYRMSFSARD